MALAFKLEEGKFGQLTYMRVYSGSVARGDNIVNVSTGKRLKVNHNALQPPILWQRSRHKRGNVYAIHIEKAQNCAQRRSQARMCG